MAESWRAHLVAVTASGCRAYFTTYGQVSSSHDRSRGPLPRPSTLMLVNARAPLPQAPVSGSRAATDPSRCGALSSSSGLASTVC